VNADAVAGGCLGLIALFWVADIMQRTTSVRSAPRGAQPAVPSHGKTKESIMHKRDQHLIELLKKGSVAPAIRKAALMPVIDDRFALRIVRKGDRYGSLDTLTNSFDEPLLEVYDITQDPDTFGPRGQFVQRYYCEDLLENAHPDGLALDLGVPEWRISAQGMVRLKVWLLAELS
jgi:hypothetical protein